MSIAFTGARRSPANDHWLLVRAPTTQLPGMESATTAGPAVHLRAPAIGSRSAGSMLGRRLRKSLADEVGENSVGLMSPSRAGFPLGRRLVDDRHDRPRDQIPVLLS